MRFILGRPVPCFFLDFTELGWFRIADGRIGVFYWVLIMIAIVLGLGYLLLRFDQRQTKRFRLSLAEQVTQTE